MAFRNSFLLATIIGFVWLILLQSIQSAPVTAGDIGTGIYHAGVVGNYAGLLSGGEALNELYAKSNTEQVAEHHDLYAKSNTEQVAEHHDFSESAAKNNPSLYESLGSLGDHLEDHEFPHDVDGAADFKAAEYENTESQAEASEQHEELQSHAEFDHGHELSEHEHEVDFGGDLHSHDFDDFYSKPIPGIDHGKGAISYSTTYEFKDPIP